MDQVLQNALRRILYAPLDRRGPMFHSLWMASKAISRKDSSNQILRGAWKVIKIILLVLFSSLLGSVQRGSPKRQLCVRLGPGRGGCGHRVLCLLPGVKISQDHGVFQKACATGELSDWKYLMGYYIYLIVFGYLLIAQELEIQARKPVHFFV